jgi:hypothetical protein
MKLFAHRLYRNSKLYRHKHYILLVGTSKYMPSAVAQSFPLSSTTLADNHVFLPSLLVAIASTKITPGVATGARYRTFINTVMAVMSGELISDAYSLLTVISKPISSSSKVESNPPCAIAGKPLIPEPVDQSVRMAGMGSGVVGS